MNNKCPIMVFNECGRKRKCKYQNTTAKKTKDDSFQNLSNNGGSSKKSHVSQQQSLSSMPIEIIDHISSFLDRVQDFVSFRCFTCRRFYARTVDYPRSDDIFITAITKPIGAKMTPVRRAQIVEQLIQRRRFPVDPSFNKNSAIKWSCMFGELETIKVLMKSDLVDASSESNLCIRIAAACGTMEMIETLFQDSRVNPFDPKERQSHIFENNAFLLAIMRGREDIVERLLQHPQSDPCKPGHSPFIFACAIGHHRVVRVLLADSRIDPNAQENMPLLEACSGGHVLVVKELLKDPRVQVTEDVLEYANFGRDSRVSSEIQNILARHFRYQKRA